MLQDLAGTCRSVPCHFKMAAKRDATHDMHAGLIHHTTAEEAGRPPCSQVASHTSRHGRRRASPKRQLLAAITSPAQSALGTTTHRWQQCLPTHSTGGKHLAPVSPALFPCPSPQLLSTAASPPTAAQPPRQLPVACPASPHAAHWLASKGVCCLLAGRPTGVAAAGPQHRPACRHSNTGVVCYVNAGCTHTCQLHHHHHPADWPPCNAEVGPGPAQPFAHTSRTSCPEADMYQL